MKAQNKILACVDQSQFAEYVADYAAWAARSMNAPLEFLHVIDKHPEIGSGDDHSGTIGFNAQENLLTQLSSQEAVRTKEIRELGRIFLNQLRERALAAGVASVDVRQRHGELQETLAEHDVGIEMVVLGRRGESANTTQRDLGRNVEGIVRSLRTPILTATEGFRIPRRAMIAFDGSVITRRGVSLVSSSPLFRGIAISVVMAGKQVADGSKQLAWAKETLTTAGLDAEVMMISGDPEIVIGKAVQEQSIELLVMGAYTHSPLRNLFFGSKTSDLLRSATIPTLLLR